MECEGKGWKGVKNTCQQIFFPSLDGHEDDVDDDDDAVEAESVEEVEAALTVLEKADLFQNGCDDETCFCRCLNYYTELKAQQLSASLHSRTADGAF